MNTLALTLTLTLTLLRTLVPHSHSHLSIPILIPSAVVWLPRLVTPAGQRVIHSVTLVLTICCTQRHHEDFLSRFPRTCYVLSLSSLPHTRQTLSAHSSSSSFLLALSLPSSFLYRCFPRCCLSSSFGLLRLVHIVVLVLFFLVCSFSLFVVLLLAPSLFLDSFLFFLPTFHKRREVWGGGLKVGLDCPSRTKPITPLQASPNDLLPDPCS